MDDHAAALLNLIVGNTPEAALIEWAVGAGTLRLSHGATIAVGGAEATCATGSALLVPYTAVSVSAGESIRLGRPTRGSFCYLAVAGGIDVPLVLGSRSTYLPAAMGGHEGRLLRAGDLLPVGRVMAAADRVPARSLATAWAELTPALSAAAIRVVRADGWDSFDASSRARFHNTEFTISARSDRTGYRLEGATFQAAAPPDSSSRVMCPGAIQIPDSGSPLVLMRDAPTTGGYPVIAVVASVDLPTLAQLTRGNTVRFVEVDIAEAHAALERRAQALADARRARDAVATGDGVGAKIK